VGILIGWFVGRAFSIFLLTVAGSHDKPHVQTNQMLIWDGLWYREIMENGYGPRPEHWPPGLGGWTTFPFFPLFPFSARWLHDLGAPMLVALTLVPHVAALAAAFGVYRLARGRFSPQIAMTAAWVTGLLPGALTFSMAYPDSLYLAASVWAVVFASERRVIPAALVALVATSARPNGALLLVVLAVVTLTAWPADPDRNPWPARVRATIVMAVPSVVFLGCWSWFMHHRTGDALAYFTAKRAWEETTLVDWVTGGGRQASFQLLVGGVFFAAVLLLVRRLPPAWTTHAVLTIGPALLLGTVGMIRYSAQAFAVPIAIAVLVAGRRWLTVGMFATLVLVSGVYSVFITRYGWVP
jgi:hypothetical protein